MNFVYHSHSFNASAVPLITTASLPLTSCLAPCTPYRSFNVERPTCVLPMVFLPFCYGFLVFLGQISGALRDCLDPEIQGTKNLAYQKWRCFVDVGVNRCLLVKVNVMKVFGVTIKFVESVGNVDENWTMVPPFP